MAIPALAWVAGGAFVLWWYERAKRMPLKPTSGSLGHVTPKNASDIIAGTPAPARTYAPGGLPVRNDGIVEMSSFNGNEPPAGATIVSPDGRVIGYGGAVATTAEPRQGQPTFDQWLEFLLNKGYLERDSGNRIWVKHPQFSLTNAPLSTAYLYASYTKYLATGWTGFEWVDDQGNYLSRSGAEQVAAEWKVASTFAQQDIKLAGSSFTNQPTTTTVKR